MFNRPIVLAACAAVLALSAPCSAQPAGAVAPIAEVRDQPSLLHGTSVPDPYRWMEDTRSPATQAWIQAQGAAARGVLDRIEGGDLIATRLAAMTQAQGDAVRSLVQVGERLYYLKRGRGEAQFSLVMRQGLDGAEKTLVNATGLAKKTGVPHAINYFSPSWDGRHLAYGVSAGGSENATLYVMAVANGRLVGQPVPRVHDTPLHWLPDSRSLTFVQTAAPKPGAPVTDTYKDSRSLWMRLGATPRAVFGAKVTTHLGLDRLDVAELITVPASRWVVARTTDTTVPEGKLFVAPLADLGTPTILWRRFGSASDQVTDVELRGDELLVLTRAGAPRRKIIAVDLGKPDLARARLLVAEPTDGVIEGFRATPGGLLTEVRRGTSIVLRRHAEGDTTGRDMVMPGPGAAGLAYAPAHDRADLLFAFSRWTEPLQWFRLDGDSAKPVALGVRAVPPGLPDLVVTDVEFPSHDGVRVPMTVLHRKGLALDGSNPVFLEGYGGYGYSTSAFFSSDNMAWIERGGVLAFVNPRGSGVHGEDWHLAGFKTTKPNTWKDGIAAARWLIDKGYGSAKTMGIMGTSAGGVFVGRAVTEAPDLFAAAIFNVGVLDAVRFEESANGATNTAEFGSVKDPAEFKALLAMSTYHQIRDGIDYPAVLLVHGLNDPRVDVWHSAKTTARLQAANPQGRPALLRLDAKAGHGVGSTLTQRQALTVDIQSFLLWRMGKAALRQ